MKRVKITVLKTTLDRDLAEEYGAEGLTACPMLREGQVFYADYAKPEGFCDEAWKAVYQYAFALAHGAVIRPQLGDVHVVGGGEAAAGIHQLQKLTVGIHRESSPPPPAR